jgi:hypothetical protein
MSEVKVNKISPRTACGTTTLGDSGDTFTIPAGVTISNSGTASGFGSSGEISWDTTVKTGDFTGVSGVGYFVNTGGGAVTVTLPSSPSAGNVIGISSYNNSASTNAITVARNGSNILGSASDFTISKGSSAVQFIYVDGTVGWQTVFTGSPSDAQNAFISATGGTVTESGDFKIHTFTGPGTFTVNNGGTAAGSNTVSYTVIGGGGSGGGGSGLGGGGGAGGFREGKASTDSYTASPLNAPAGLPVTGGSGYPIVVGGGGTAVSPSTRGNSGTNSSFSTIIGAGGGGGGGSNSSTPLTGIAGGSGGGGGENSGCVGSGGGAGNTPPVSPPQGQNGGTGYGGSPGASAAGGGGAGAVGQAGQPGGGGAGGAGVATSITGSPVTRAGGGGGAGYLRSPGSGGSGGGGSGSSNPVPADATAGTANTGGGGGGGVLTSTPEGNGAQGGSGIVVIRYKFQ